jgi:hypothetical protein
LTDLQDAEDRKTVAGGHLRRLAESAKRNIPTGARILHEHVQIATRMCQGEGFVVGQLANLDAAAADIDVITLSSADAAAAVAADRRFVEEVSHQERNMQRCVTTL